MRARRSVPALALAVLSAGMLVLSACGDDDDSASGASDEAKQVAFLSPSAANTYVSETYDVVERIGAENNVEVTEFDAGFDVAKQQQQIQNVIASGQYDGIIINPLTDAVAVDLAAASDAGIEVATAGQIIGEDYNATTSEPQVEGVSLSVLETPFNTGSALGEVTTQACEGKDPCRVVYFYGIKGTPNDEAYFAGFEDSIAQDDTIEIVATGEGKYEGPDVALSAMQNIMQSTPEFDVVVGVDQSMQGVQLALEQANKLEDVAIIGIGGSEAAIEAIRAGDWFGGVMTAPQTEGELVMDGMLDLLDDGELSGPSGVSPLSDVPNNGRITQENVDEFEAQWKG